MWEIYSHIHNACIMVSQCMPPTEMCSGPWRCFRSTHLSFLPFTFLTLQMQEEEGKEMECSKRNSWAHSQAKSLSRWSVSKSRFCYPDI